MFVDQPPDCTRLVEQTRAWPAAGSAEEIRRFTELFAQRADCERLAQAGWSPIAAVAEAGGQVRRVSFEEGRLSYRIPAVVLERRPGGEVEVRLSIDRPDRIYRARAPAEVWRKLTANDAAARRPPPTPRLDAIPSISFCHGWFVTLEATEHRRTWTRAAHQCRPADRAALEYGVQLAEIAIEYIPQCAAAKAEMAEKQPAEDNAIWALISCAGRVGIKTLG